ncbi:vWA-like protein [Dacryopinax primogenitus]|uniref:VWA-like protein n=1 Tax=Dacryopinax primogenitus (strain DJM 731) TaxID=1858805 RepID=M5G4U3_DACPD|nr:vWA-like protein [Dacryopinax primogenitus]EJT98762.1 vWA-like protein [Dacryopinax primogenitus]
MATLEHAGYVPVDLGYGAPSASYPTAPPDGDSMDGDRDMDMATAMDGLDIEEPMVASSAYAASSTGPVPMNPENGLPRKMLDLVFIQDATGSQGSYISHATENIEEICNTIANTGKLVRPEDLRLGLIAFRDHPPQDNTFITKKFPFTSDVAEMKANLKTLYASGGGDGPEAVTAALYDALNMDWRPEARRMVVLIADAPPHGLGEYGDGFDSGSPDGHDPIQIVREMATRGITLFFVACEPALSGYLYANEFYHAMTSLTGGTVLPLTTSSLLSHAIIGSVLENLDMEDLIREVGQHVANRVLGGDDVDDIARQLHEHLMLRNENTKKLKIESIYRTSEESAHNINVWLQASDLASARPLLKKVTGSRFTDKYQASKYSTTKGGIYHYSSSASSFSPYAPTLPPRGGVIPTEPTMVTPPMTPIRGPTSSPPSSNKFGDFAAFSAPKTTLSTSPFGVSGGITRKSFDMRDGSGIGRALDDDDDDDDDRDLGRKVPGMSFEEDSISYDQVRRIVIASTFRGMRT